MTITWAALTAAEPRLQSVLDAARALVDPAGELHAEAVYVMAKPLIGWLVGYRRGRAPDYIKRGVPEGTRLWAMCVVARPFDPSPSPLGGDHAYTEACGLINEYLHQAQQQRAG